MVPLLRALGITIRPLVLVLCHWATVEMRIRRNWRQQRSTSKNPSTIPHLGITLGILLRLPPRPSLGLPPRIPLRTWNPYRKSSILPGIIVGQSFRNSYMNSFRDPFWNASRKRQRERDKERVSQPSSQEPERRQEGERDRERERERDR